MKYRNPLHLLDAIEELNMKLEGGQFDDLRVANLLVRGHSNAARAQANAINLLKIAHDTGVATNERLEDMLPSRKRIGKKA